MKKQRPLSVRDQYIYIHTLYIKQIYQIRQFGVPTKLDKHDSIIPITELTPQMIDLRSTLTIC